MNTALTLSTLSTSTLEEVSEACGETVRFLQLYVGRDHEATRRLVLRAERAGYSAIFFTVDVPVFGKRRAQYYNPSILPPHLQSVFTGRQRSCKPCTSYDRDVRPSVCLSVRPSVTRWH